MEAKQFFNYSISPLVTKTFACKWSEDNKLSIVTEKGVHVFEIIPSPKQINPMIKIIRSFIYSPEILPSEIYLNDITNEIYDWKKDDVLSFLLNDAYLPIFPNAAKVSPEIIDVSWSPEGLLYPGKCLLAVITSVGAVVLVREIDRNWISIYEFTSPWVEIIDSDFKALKENNKLDHETIKDQLDRLLITTVTWSFLHLINDSTSFAYFVSAHKNTEIVIWKVNKILNDDININASPNVELKFKKRLTSKSVRINSLLWIDLKENNYLLIVGYINGQMGSLKLQEFEEGITSNSYEVFYDYIDNTPVDLLQLWQQTDDWIEFVAVKGMHLTVFVLDNFGKMISMNFTSSPGLMITGASVISSNVILFVTQDGMVCTVERLGDQKELVCTTVNCDIPKNHARYLGLANSLNKMQFSLITSPSIIYDHLIDREPSNIWLFSLQNVTSLNPVDILYKNIDQSLSKYWDCLELIKINAFKYNNLSTILPKISLDLESLSLNELRITYWIMIISRIIKNKNFKNDELEKDEDIKQANLHIFLYSASNHLSHLVKQEEHLTDLQKLYTSLLRNHLEIWLAGEEDEAETPLSKLVKQVLESIKKFDLIEQENCSLCGVLITEPWLASCSNGHKLPRCAITTLQTTCTKFRKCNICEEIFHPCLDLEMDQIRCLYCDLPVFYRSDIQESLLKFKKNLSRKQQTVTIIIKDELDTNDKLIFDT